MALRRIVEYKFRRADADPAKICKREGSDQKNLRFEEANDEPDDEVSAEESPDAE